MKLQSTGWKLPVLIGILVIVALLMDFFFFTKATARREAKAQEQRQTASAAEAKQAAEKQAQEQKEAEAKRVRDEAEAKTEAEERRKKVAEDGAAEHARFMAHYLNSGFTRKPGVAIIGVAVESETGTMDPSVASALAQRFETGGVQLLNSFFKPEFVADKYVARIFAGETGIFDRLELTNWLSGVLIGHQTITYATNPTLQNTVTASSRLQVMALPVGLTWQSQSWTLSANGVGFSESDARMQAEERLIHRIASDSTMSLSNLTTNK
jgi:hypothetical protein